jgi:hypothetical protein
VPQVPPGGFASVVQPPHPLTPASPLPQATVFAPEQAHVPPMQVPQGVFGWFERVEQPMHAFIDVGCWHVTLSVPEHVHVPPPQAPHVVLGWFERTVQPPHAFGVHASPASPGEPSLAPPSPGPASPA